MRVYVCVCVRMEQGVLITSTVVATDTLLLQFVPSFVRLFVSILCIHSLRMKAEFNQRTLTKVDSLFDFIFLFGTLHRTFTLKHCVSTNICTVCNFFSVIYCFVYTRLIFCTFDKTDGQRA